MSRNVSDEERDRIFKNGIFKTVIEKDTRYTEHHAYVIAFEKSGTKYIHGIVCHKDDQDGQVKPNYWVAQIDKTNAKIVDGARWDLVDQEREFRTQKRGHERRRQDAEREISRPIEQETRDRIRAAMDQWDKDNPEPKDPLEAVIEQESKEQSRKTSMQIDSETLGNRGSLGER